MSLGFRELHYRRAGRLLELEGWIISKKQCIFRYNSAYNIRTHRDYDNTHRSNTSTNQTESQHSDGEIGMSSHSPPRRYFQIVTAHEILVISWDSHWVHKTRLREDSMLSSRWWTQWYFWTLFLFHFAFGEHYFINLCLYIIAFKITSLYVFASVRTSCVSDSFSLY